MSYPYYAIPIALAVLVSAAAFVLIHRVCPPKNGKLYLMLFCAAAALASLFYCLELIVQNTAAQTMFHNFQYLFKPYIPTLFLTYMLVHTGRLRRLSPRNLLLLFGVPLLITLLAWTNEFHGLLYILIETVGLPGGVILSYDYGIAYILYMYWITMCTCALVIFISYHYLRQVHSKKLGAALLMAVITPAVLDVLHLSGVRIFHINLISLGLAVSCSILYYAVRHTDFIREIPMDITQIVQLTQNGIIVLDAQRRVLGMNPAAERILDVRMDHAYLLQAEDVFAQVFTLDSEPGSMHGQEIVIDRHEEQQFYFLHISPIPSTALNAPCEVMIIEDISDRKKEEQRIDYLSYYDEVTGLPNRALFVEFLKKELMHVRRYGGLVGIAIVSINNYAAVCDTTGREACDLMLFEAAQRIQNTLRRVDTITKVSEDEFFIILHKLTGGRQDAHDVMQRLFEAFEQPFTVGGQPVQIHISAGISIAPEDADTPERLIRNADTAIYYAQLEESAHMFKFYHQDMNKRLETRRMLNDTLRQALENGELKLYYQPILDIRSGRVRCAEALMRWDHPTLGRLSPTDFLDTAEEMGLSGDICAWLFDTACKQLGQWRHAGQERLNISVNLYETFLKDKTLPDLCKRVLQKYALDAQHVEVEIAEKLAVGAEHQAIDNINALHELGLSIAVDNFGMGYTSLIYLNQLHIQKLKLDRILASEIVSDPNCDAIVRGIVSLSKNMHLKMVAQNVETKEQLDILIERGCRMFQGDYFKKPVLPDECFDYIQEKNNP